MEKDKNLRTGNKDRFINWLRTPAGVISFVIASALIILGCSWQEIGTGAACAAAGDNNHGILSCPTPVKTK